MKYLPIVSVIIPTYNRSAYIQKTIRSIINQNYPKDLYEIIVVDNNSSDETGIIIRKESEESPVEIHYVEESLQGVHYARNSAAKIARGEILYFTDDDMIADSNLLSSLVYSFSIDPLVGSATGKILPRFEVPPPRWVERCLINGYLSLTELNRPEQFIISTNGDMVYSCHQAVLRDVFFKAGGFNPENTAGVWIGDGETGLNLKIKALGYRFAYTATSIIYHIIPQERMTLSYLVRRIGNQGYCDSYTEYRSHRTKSKIVPTMLIRSTVGAIKLLTITAVMAMLGRESWHFIPARLAYLYRRLVYDLKLFSDDDFRKVVEIDDWLVNDFENIRF